ncbi:MAG: hypothetical protein GWN32_10115 [Gemmatimonadetes bacterium]|nr:hypothetical protein [Gemmatimonadota bacterium]NIW36863.1 hypothetical protein [Gemmatimonadota bacterium]
MEPPFVTDRDDTGPKAAPSPATPDVEETAPVPEPDLGAEPVPTIELPEPAESTRSEGEVLIDAVFREDSPGLEREGELAPPPSPAASASGAERVAESTEVEVDEAGLPDFLSGADAVGPDLEPSEPPAALSDDVTDTARDLFRGKHGEQIKKLAAELGPAADDEIISRAFAAGYLAAKREQRE